MRSSVRALFVCLVLTGEYLVPVFAAPQVPASQAIVPFKIHVPDEVLADLKLRLRRTRFPDEVSDSGWAYGTSLDYLRQLVTYWRDRYDWRAQERQLNQLPQFKTNIDGLDIHFMHRRSTARRRCR
jgi:hypothetical protein